MTYLVFLASDTPLPLHFAVCTLNHFRKFQALKHNSWAFFSLHSGCELITNATPPHLSDSFGHILIRRGEGWGVHSNGFNWYHRMCKPLFHGVWDSADWISMQPLSPPPPPLLLLWKCSVTLVATLKYFGIFERKWPWPSSVWGFCVKMVLCYNGFL